jgi:hypothetical protein
MLLMEPKRPKRDSLKISPELVRFTAWEEGRFNAVGVDHH